MRIGLISLLSLLLFFPGVSGAAAPVPSQQQTVEIGIFELPYRFEPKEVTITSGTTVVWVNHSKQTHTTTSNTFLWHSGDVLPGQSFSRTFDQPGTYPYHCVYHESLGQVGTITVVQPLTPSATPTVMPTPTPPAAPALTPTPQPAVATSTPITESPTPSSQVPSPIPSPTQALPKEGQALMVSPTTTAAMTPTPPATGGMESPGALPKAGGIPLAWLLIFAFISLVIGLVTKQTLYEG